MYLSTKSFRQRHDVTQGQFFTGWKLVFSLAKTGILTQAQESSLPFYLPAESNG